MMFGNNFTLFEFMGFRVRANVSWLFLAILVTWSLAAGYFPATFPGLDPATYWWLGVVGMIGLFVSLLFHEFAHSVVARARGLEIRGITLFLFGGVAEMAAEPDSPKTEFWMAIAGPAASVLLAGGFYALGLALQAAGLPPHIVGVAGHLSFLNLVLAAFNMVPGFPLDGGRVLRAGLWHFSGNLRAATRRATRVGQGVGLALAALGIVSALGGAVVAGIWWVLIGLFLQGAATAAYQRLLAQEALKGQSIRDVMTADPVTVPPDITLQRFVDDYLYRYSYDLFPVVADGRLAGCIGLKDVRRVAQEDWSRTRVASVAGTCSARNTIRPDAEASEALERMREADSGRLIVADGPRLAGVLVLKDLLHRLSVRAELERSA